MKAFREQMNTSIQADDSGNVDLAEVMKVVEAATPSMEDREALDMQAALQAYFKVAVARFADEIPMRLNDLILMRFVDEMTNELNGLTDATLKMAERRQLKEEFVCLVNAKKEIEFVR